MSLEGGSAIGAAAVGVGATLGMDLWNLFLKRGAASASSCAKARVSDPGASAALD